MWPRLEARAGALPPLLSGSLPPSREGPWGLAVRGLYLTPPASRTHNLFQLPGGPGRSLTTIQLRGTLHNLSSTRT